MDCSDVPTTVPDDDALAAVVSDLRESGLDVVLGVVGPPGPARRAAGRSTPTFAVTAADEDDLEDIAVRVYPVPDRCVVLVRSADVGWELMGTGWAEGELVVPASDGGVARRRLRVDGHVFTSALLGEVVGAGTGVAVGVGVSAVLIAAGCESHAGGCAVPLVLGVPLGAWVGTLVGGVMAAERGKEWVPVIGSLVGSAMSAGFIAAASDGASAAGLALLVPLAILAPPLGASVTVGTPGGVPGAVVSVSW